MKKIICLILAFSGLQVAIAQSDKETQLLEKMNVEACDEINKATFSPDDKTSDTEMKIGAAILPSFGRHKQDIMNVWGLDVDKAEDSKKVGEKLGAYMVFKCDKFQQIALQMAASGKLNKDQNQTAAEPAAMKSNDTEIAGTIEKIEGTDLDVIHVKTNTGETVKLLWLDRCEGTDILENYLKAKKSMHYKFRYRTQNMFQPKTKTYQSVKVISSILES